MNNQVLNGVKLMETEKTDEIREKGYNICREYLNGAWGLITPDEFIIKKLSGGLSNFLYLCALPDNRSPIGDEPTKVLLRIYGQDHSDAQTKFITECVIFTLLSENNRGPRLYGVFPGGRLEEYIPARPLSTDELSDDNLSLVIADSIAEIHSMNVPLSKEPRWLWGSIESWLRKLENKKEVLKVNNLLGNDLKEELRWLRNYLSTIRSPVVFCHNDLQEGNILKKTNVDETNQKTKNLMIIDFEYCSYNYRGFDLANHFCETINPLISIKMSGNPLEKFVRRYLSKLNKSDGDVSDEEVDDVLKEIRAYTLASHMYWGIWSVVNSVTALIDFDYWSYGKYRFNAYLNHKMSLFEDEEEESQLIVVDSVLQRTEGKDGITIPRARSSSLIETN
ncbi:choline/ethanolamine kinase, putative [Pediculus humanus corporis]|uniref:Choline/ethanolamine kinase, putative n=1 Tax=Pediculus humanus subsp. corporis TaxID=121224 RepID=E0VSW6_PEDHC|nr:choline/ethanolamine kinase, putative [Pediculus humanus corporis]EEB16472.1 choline/ethanolamine kinase, putative [Pediculus humanus corporis]